MPCKNIPNIRDDIEVTLRICLSLILINILTLGSFPNVIPPSQTVTISTVASAFTMVLPTLLFSIGPITGMIVTAVVATLVATALLAVAATGSVEAYVVAYFCFALILSGLRYTSEGSNTAVLIMLSAILTISLSENAEKEGISFVKSLWTERGTDNPKAVFRNTLIGMCWVSACLAFARLLPPARTVRHTLSTKLLPKVLKDLAKFIKLTVELHVKDDIDDEDNSDDEADDTADTNESGERQSAIDNMIMEVVNDAQILIAGGIVDLTVFEPRVTKCCIHPPADVVTLLYDLTNSVNDVIMASLSLRAFSKAGFKEIEMEGLKGVYESAAALLDKCAEALSTSNLIADEIEQDKDPESCPPAVDPLRLSDRALRCKRLTNEWIVIMGYTDTDPYQMKSHFDKEALNVYTATFKTWILGIGFGLVAAIVGCVYKGISPMTWRRIKVWPHYNLLKFIWCIKFAIGFTALVVMQIYWPSFANLIVPTHDEDPTSHFAGWSLIAYAFSTTQTVEGTWKKSILRALGTVTGAFSGWLALTACNTNPWGLGAWMTIMSTIVAYLGLPTGFSSRFGLDHDLAWGPAYFAMTQALVAMEVYWGYGTKNDITVTRILGNLAGILMATIMATIPPGIYGGSPRVAAFLVEDKKRALKECIELVLQGSGSDATLTNDEVREKLYHLYSSARATFKTEFAEANDNYKDATQLHNLPILKVDKRMKLGLDLLTVLGSSVLSLIRFGILLTEIEPDREVRFCVDSKERNALETILKSLDIVDDPQKISGFYAHHHATSGKSHARPDVLSLPNEDKRVVPAHTTFAHFAIYLCNYITHRERLLDDIHYGFCGGQHYSLGTRTTWPGSLIKLGDGTLYKCPSEKSE